VEHVLLCEPSHNEAGDHNIGQRQREQKLPAERHQLVIAETRQRTADPDVNKDESDNFQNKPEYRRERLKYRRQEAWNWTSPSTKEQRGRDTGDGEHIAIFRNKEDGELHR